MQDRFFRIQKALEAFEVAQHLYLDIQHTKMPEYSNGDLYWKGSQGDKSLLRKPTS